ncbi:hypothetical protein SRABI128_01852 [Microbacterium sp. Bi128]|nr:hypothetical protein SRABI128_01852 [Microbacterium sp. Bi128]
MVAAVPMLDPETAENPAHAMTVATPSPPGNRLTKWLAIANTCSAIRARIASIPIRMNIGMIVSEKLAVAENGTEPSTFVAYVVPCSTPRPRAPDRASERATGIRAISSRMSSATTASTMIVTSMDSLLVFPAGAHASTVGSASSP